MSWRLEEIIAFLHVVEAGSITAAARRLKLSKSVVSKRITDLEAALHQQLLRRSTRSVRPTEEGRVLYTRVKPLVGWRNDIEGLGKLLSEHIPNYRNLMTSYTAQARG